MIEREQSKLREEQQEKQAAFKDQMENAQDAVSKEKEDLGDGLEKMKVAELRAILIEQGMDAKGKKADLIERIRKA